MRKFLRFLALSLALPLSTQAQDFLGYSNSNYAGVNGLDLNPASFVDGRYRVDILLGGFSLLTSNNFIGIKREAFENRTGKLLPPDSTTTFPAFNDSDFMDKYLTIRHGDRDRSVMVRNNIYLPSFMFHLNQKNAIGITSRVRSYVNVDGISGTLASQLYDDLQDPNASFWNQRFSNKHVSVQYMSWAEYGLNYGRVILDQEKHFLKAGVRVKLLQGLGAAYMYIDNLDYRVDNSDTMSFFHSEVKYGHSTNFEFTDSTFKYKFTSKPGVGLDIGVIYEYRPDWEKYKYDMDGETNLWMRYKNKYKLRAGFSITDIGSVKFERGTYSRDFTADVNYWNVRDLKFDSLPIKSFDDTIINRFTTQVLDNEKFFRMNLPTAISAQVDYNIWKDVYVNFTGFMAVQRVKNVDKVHEMTTFSLSPRWDSKWFGIFVPFSYNQHQNFQVGTDLRLGPLVFGTNDLPTLFLKKKEAYGAEFHFAIKVPIMYRPVKDRDKDKISDKKDKCRDVPGVWEFMGCPDRDGDHVQDSEDACPDEAGLKEFNGCPDRDGDKIIDKQDACPDEAGLPQFNGCPDKDGDGIMDKEDDCPDVAGLKEFKGCPDKDGDSIPDKDDLCPEKFGPRSNQGCPETKLSLVERFDPHAVQKTVVQNKSDGSFVFDAVPHDSIAVFKLEGENTDGINVVNVVVGTTSKKALRSLSDGLFRFEYKKVVVLTKEEQEVLKKAFDNLEFETAKDVIRKTSYASLDELAALMIKKPDWKLKLSGHTDNQGKPAANMKLSEKRAKSVKKYLVSKGVADTRILTEWFGQTKPIAPNTTPEGRQKNRRVEMVIID